MTERASVCVVIPAYGDMPHIVAILEALERGSRVPDRIVVSHSGPHPPGDELKQMFQEVLFLHSDARLFAGAARNRGAAAATECILAFCDSDVLPSPDWLECIVSVLEESARRFTVGSIGIARTGGYWGMTNWLCEFSELAPWRVSREQVGGASANMAVRREHFELAGGFPGEVRTGQDTLFFHALRGQGLQQWFVPESVVGHFNHSGLPSMARHQWMHGRSFVRLRRRAQLPGARVVRAWWPAPLLPVAKMLRIVGRLLKAGPRQWVMVFAYLPGIIVAMTCWGSGLARELFSGTSRSSDSLPGS